MRCGSAGTSQYASNALTRSISRALRCMDACCFLEINTARQFERIAVDEFSMPSIFLARSNERPIRKRKIFKKPLTGFEVKLSYLPARKQAESGAKKSQQKNSKSLLTKRKVPLRLKPRLKRLGFAEEARKVLKDDWDFKLNSTLSRRLKGAMAEVGNDKAEARFKSRRSS